MVAEITDGRFIIQPFAAGEIVPGLQAIDAVQKDAVEMAHTVSFYNLGKDPAWALGTGLPFGMNARQQNAWLYHGGGAEILDAFYAKHGIVAFPAGNSGARGTAPIETASAATATKSSSTNATTATAKRRRRR